MIIYVINLASRPDRLKASQEQFAKFDLVFERIDAVNGYRLTSDEIDHAHKRGPLGLLARGDIGCFLSHREAWKRIAEGSERFGVVMEDDVIFGKRFSTLLQSMTQADFEFDVIKLDRSGNKKLLVLLGQIARQYDVIAFKHLLSKHTGCGAYIISRSCARRALEASLPFNVSVDHFLYNRNNSAFARNILSLQAQPAVVRHGLIHLDKGNINAGRRAQITHDFAYWKRELVRGFYEVKRIPMIIWDILRGARLEKILYQDD